MGRTFLHYEDERGKLVIRPEGDEVRWEFKVKGEGGAEVKLNRHEVRQMLKNIDAWLDELPEEERPPRR